MSFIGLCNQVQKEALKMFSSKRTVDFATLFIGNSGAGKSSLIQLLGGKLNRIYPEESNTKKKIDEQKINEQKINEQNDYNENTVKIGHGVESEISPVSLFIDELGHYYLDSVGFNGTRGMSSEQCELEILHVMYKHKIHKLRVVWCVSYDTAEKANTYIKQQARFIELLHKKIFRQTVLIVEKCGTYDSKHKVTSVYSHILKELNYSEHDIDEISMVSLTCLGFIENEETKKQKLENVSDGGKIIESIRKKQGLLYKQEFKDYIAKELAKLKPVSLVYQRSYCLKCGVEGEAKTFQLYPCHKDGQSSSRNIPPIVDTWKCASQGWKNRDQLTNEESWQLAGIILLGITEIIMPPVWIPALLPSVCPTCGKFTTKCTGQCAGYCPICKKRYPSPVDPNSKCAVVKPSESGHQHKVILIQRPLKYFDQDRMYWNSLKENSLSKTVECSKIQTSQQ